MTDRQLEATRLEGKFVTPSSQAAVLAALAVHGERLGERWAWMAGEDLAHFVGAPGPDDPQLAAVVRSLYAAGAIRLTTEDSMNGEAGYKAMLVRPV